MTLLKKSVISPIPDFLSRCKLNLPLPGKSRATVFLAALCKTTFLPATLLLLVWPIAACRQKQPEPVTITFVDPEWSHDMSPRRDIMDETLRQFTKQTGIQIRHLPAPESVADQLSLTSQMLDRSTADVYGIDVIWPGILQSKLLDLAPHFVSQLAAMDPEIIANFTVHGRLVALPYHTNVGVLYYRSDLLREYGFRKPPKSWDELEEMAARIQAGERAKGHADFWGYLWPGAASEGLTCDALEWQFAEGGGHIIEPDGKISVNNPNTIRAWQRAARWIGTISPPNVLTYQEWDSINAFRYSRKAAFLRSWASDYFLSHPLPSEIADREGVAGVPGGPGWRAGTMGGLGLAVAKSSTHQNEAIRLVQFLLQTETQSEEVRRNSPQAVKLVMEDLPPILKAYSHPTAASGYSGSGVVARPSTVTAEKYDSISHTYFAAVYSVLTGKAKADSAASQLEKELITITGFQTGPPPSNHN